MNPIFLFPNAVRRDPEVEAWFARPDDALRLFAKPWFDRPRGCGGVSRHAEAAGLLAAIGGRELDSTTKHTKDTKGPAFSRVHRKGREDSQTARSASKMDWRLS